MGSRTAWARSGTMRAHMAPYGPTRSILGSKGFCVNPPSVKLLCSSTQYCLFVGTIYCDWLRIQETLSRPLCLDGSCWPMLQACTSKDSPPLFFFQPVSHPSDRCNSTARHSLTKGLIGKIVPDCLGSVLALNLEIMRKYAFLFFSGFGFIDAKPCRIIMELRQKVISRP